MLAELIDFTASSLAAWGAEPPRKRPSSRDLRRGKMADAPGGPLWTKQVVGAKFVAPFIIAFAKENQTFRFELNDIPLGIIRIPRQPVVVADGIIASYERQFHTGKLVQEKQELSFESLGEGIRDRAKSLCRADDWTTFGYIQTKFAKGFLKPDVNYVNGNAELVWSNPPRARWARYGWWGWLQRRSETALLKFIIRPDGGEIVTDGPFKNFLLPDLVWS